MNRSRNPSPVALICILAMLIGVVLSLAGLQRARDLDRLEALERSHRETERLRAKDVDDRREAEARRAAEAAERELAEEAAESKARLEDLRRRTIRATPGK